MIKEIEMQTESTKKREYFL